MRIDQIYYFESKSKKQVFKTRTTYLRTRFNKKGIFVQEKFRQSMCGKLHITENKKFWVTVKILEQIRPIELITSGGSNKIVSDDKCFRTQLNIYDGDFLQK